VWKSTSATGALFTKSFLGDDAADLWLGRAARNRHRHAIEQASRRWRGGRRDDSARTRRKILISTQAVTPAPPRTEASESELALEGKVFEDEGIRWRVDEVYFDEDVKALCASYYDFDARGFVPPDDEDASEVDLGVPRCCGAFTPSTRLVSIRRGRRWFLF
jgi:hypothetical protein